MNAIFITGTDTGVGKTIITGLLARYLSGKGLNVITQKWVQTGVTSVLGSDINTHLKIMGRSLESVKKYLPNMLPYQFEAACSAHLASALEQKRIDIGKIKRSFRLLSAEFDFVIVEGLGGALVPYSTKNLVIDIAKKLDLPVLIVAENKLGAINHALLTIEALKKRKMKVTGIVFNTIGKEKKFILKDNPKIVGLISRQKILGALPPEASYDKLYKKFIPIAKNIMKELGKK